MIFALSLPLSSGELAGLVINADFGSTTQFPVPTDCEVLTTPRGSAPLCVSEKDSHTGERQRVFEYFDTWKGNVLKVTLRGAKSREPALSTQVREMLSQIELHDSP